MINRNWSLIKLYVFRFILWIEMRMQFVRMFLRKRGGDKVCIFGLNMSSNDIIGNLIDDPVWSKHELNLIVWI